MHIVICEDELCFQEAIVNAVKEWSLASANLNMNCSCFCSSEELLARWEAGLPVDLLFLDIQIPGELSGMALAKQIRQRDPNVSIVFVTNYADYVYEGYVVNALRYLKKPVKNDEIFACLEIAYRRHTLLSQDRLPVICRDQRLVLSYSEIIYVEVQSHYLWLSLTRSAEKPAIRARLRDFIIKLPTQLFVQCHRSYVVNLDHIRRFTRESMMMSNHDVIPVSQTFASALKKKYEWYYMGVNDQM